MTVTRSATSANGQSGFSLIEVVIALGVVSVTMLAFASFSTLSTDYQSKVRTRNDLFQVKSDIIRNIGSQQNWFTMISKAGTDVYNNGTTVNNALLCVRDGTPCAAGDHELTLLSANGSVFLDSTKPEAGFTREGMPCNTYDPAATSGTCTSKFKASWSPVCPPSGPCVRPQIMVHLSFATTDTSASLNSLLGTQIPVDTLIEQARVQRPLVKRYSTYTNSPVVYAANSAIELTPLDNVINSYNSMIPAFAPAASQNGGTVTRISETKIKYEPRADFYGTDFFTYPVKDVASGKVLLGRITVRVMTPYTWTGLATAGNIKSSANKNFCGKVVNGACDGTTFPASGWGLGYYLNLVFDSTCTNCNAELDRVQTYTSVPYPFQAHTIEMTSAYRGNVRLLNNAQISGAGGPWRQPMNLRIAGGTFDATGIPTVDINSGAWSYPHGNEVDYAMRVQGAGVFKAPAQLNVNGAFYAAGPASFVNNGGSARFNGNWSRNQVMYAPNVEFSSIQFTNGWVSLSSNFTVLNQVLFSNSMPDGIRNGPDPHTWTPAPRPVIAVKGNIAFEGNGGMNCGTGTAAYCAGAIFELNGPGDQEIIGIDTTAFDIDLSNVGSKVSTAPSIRINKTSGKTTMTGAVGVRRDFTIANIQDYDFSNSELVFDGADCGVQVFRAPESVEFKHIYELTPGCAGSIDYGSETITVRGNFYSYSSHSGNYGDAFNSATIKLHGDFHHGAYHHHMSRSRAVQLKFVGAGDQTLRRTPFPNGTMPDHAQMDMNVLVDKPSGTLFLEGRITTMGDFLVDNGAVVGKPGSALINYPHGWNWDKTTIRAPAAQFDTIELGHTVKIIGDVHTKNLKVGTFADAGGYGFESGSGTGRFFVSENLDFNHTYSTIWTASDISYVLDGAGAQLVRFNGGAAQREDFRDMDIKIAKTGGTVTMSGDGKLKKVCVNSPNFSMDPTSSLIVTGKLGAIDASYFQQNGATFTGTTVLPDASCN